MGGALMDQVVEVSIVDESIVVEIVDRGVAGPPGEPGPPGAGVPEGGTTGQSLVRDDDDATAWADRVASLTAGDPDTTDPALIPGWIDDTDPANPVLYSPWRFRDNAWPTPPSTGTYYGAMTAYGIPIMQGIIADGAYAIHLDHSLLGIPVMSGSAGDLLVMQASGDGSEESPLQFAAWANPTDAIPALADKVAKAGDTMTGDLTLADGARLVVHRDDNDGDVPLVQLRNPSAAPQGNILEVLGHIATGEVRYGMIWDEGAQCKTNTSVLISGTFAAQEMSEPPGGPSYMLGIVSDLASGDASVALYPPAGAPAGTVTHIAAYNSHATSPTRVWALTDTGEVLWHTDTRLDRLGGGILRLDDPTGSLAYLRLAMGASEGSGGIQWSPGGSTQWSMIQYGGDSHLYMMDVPNARSVWHTWPGSAGNAGVQISDHLEIKRGSSGQTVPLLDIQDHSANSLVQVAASGDLTLSDGVDLIAGTTTGTKLGSTATDKLGMWGAAPIVQPTTTGAAATFAAGTGSTVTDDATFDGYTVGRVIKALREAGVLA